ncbi:DUF4389 domain-containing protein [Desulfoluna butyratoxydans]|uniref:DUF4389 domain-containing protein n=1 Tax=Desulfoluna butyratoxydans TaxID=231438 RepID=A0A4U8YKV7_9BACT|nr:DUF4389 domain-containing protein [Desulfoluna butyratoxydans]VFQ44536.1 protein of unknown function duf4389 [Desulfoluna butyratoxydans]
METKSDSDSSRVAQGIRALFMLAFWIASRVVLAIVVVLALFQLICSLVTRSPNDKIMRFGKNLGVYLSQIVDFLTYNTDQKPWPFQDWPRY